MHRLYVVAHHPKRKLSRVHTCPTPTHPHSPSRTPCPPLHTLTHPHTHPHTLHTPSHPPHTFSHTPSHTLSYTPRTLSHPYTLTHSHTLCRSPTRATCLPTHRWITLTASITWRRCDWAFSVRISASHIHTRNARLLTQFVRKEREIHVGRRRWRRIR